MTPDEARRTIASYLTGQRVRGEDLERAWAIARSDADHLRHLTREFGMEEHWISDCDVFRSSIAEFSEMSRREREREAPELLQHAEVCEACRRAYWDFRPLWISEATHAVAAKGRTIIRELAERIRLAVDAAGRLLELGPGPQSVREPLVAATVGTALTGSVLEAGAGLPPELERKEWVLPDEETKWTIRLAVSGLPSGDARVTLRLEGEAGIFKSAQVRIEVRAAEGDSLLLAGRLSDFETEPILLPRGSWILRLLATTAEGSRVWEIPLDITEGAGANGETDE